MQNCHQINPLNPDVNFMKIVHDLHHQKIAIKEKDKKKRKNEARRAIEIHQEMIQLKLNTQEWWDDI